MEEVKRLIEQHQAELLGRLIEAGIDAEKCQGTIRINYQASVWVEVSFSVFTKGGNLSKKVMACIIRDSDNQRIKIGFFSPTLIEGIKDFLNANI